MLCQEVECVDIGGHIKQSTGKTVNKQGHHGSSNMLNMMWIHSQFEKHLLVMTQNI